MKKIFMVLTMAALFCSFSLGALAADTDISHPAAETLTEGEAAKNTEASADTPTDTEGYNVFALVYEKITEYSGEIFCALTLIGTAILSFAYKKGLLPLIKSSLSAIGGAVGALRENAEKEGAVLSRQGAKLDESLARAESVLEIFSEKLSALEARLTDIEGIKAGQSATEIMLDCQIDALSDIFMSSSLPEYKKAALGERIIAMREALKNVKNTGDKD